MSTMPWMICLAIGFAAGPEEEAKKAALLKALGSHEPLDNVMVPSIAKFLAPGAKDPNYLLPMVAIEALSRFRGSAPASRALMGVLPAYQKLPFLHRQVVPAVGKIGHETALPFFEAWLKGKDPEQAVLGVRAIEQFPPSVAIDRLFFHMDVIEKKKENASPEVKAVYDRLGPEILKSLKRISGQPYPTLKELLIWYQRRGKEEMAKKDAERKPEPVSEGLPVPLLVELTFRENAGAATANGGTTGAAFATASVAGGKTPWTGTVAPNAGPSALQWIENGAVAVDLGGGPGLETLKGLKSFTITGWTIVMASGEGAASKEAGAGNRVVSWLNPVKTLEGVELVQRADGSLQLGINQWADQSAAKSAAESLPVYNKEAKEANAENQRTWRFFAVTYDSTAAAGHVKFYFGTRNADAKAAGAADYDRGVAGFKVAPHFTVGNVSPLIRSTAPDRAYRGILDEIRVFGSDHDGSGALPLPELIRIQNRELPTP
jgi:hypothetical protein